MRVPFQTEVEFDYVENSELDEKVEVGQEKAVLVFPENSRRRKNKDERIRTRRHKTGQRKRETSLDGEIERLVVVVPGVMSITNNDHVVGVYFHIATQQKTYVMRKNLFGCHKGRGSVACTDHAVP